MDACFVDLTKVADAALVPGLIASELGLRTGPGGDWEPVLAEALRDQPALLVLDNVEHVVDAAAVVSRLAQVAPALRVLAASRVRLHVAGEHVVDVAPLRTSGEGVPDAMALFGQVAVAVDPTFELAAHADDVRAICTAVDGLPLAIELAAGHVRTLPPQLLRARLGARLAAVEPRLAGRVHVAAGFLQWPRSTTDARQHWATAVELFRRVGDRRNEAYALGLQSGTFLGDAAAYDDGVRMCDDAIRLARAVGERPLLAQVLNVKGELTRVHGDDDRALEAYQEGLELAVAAGDEAHVGIFLANLAYLAVHRGDGIEARRLGREALRVCWQQGHRMMSAWTVSELAGPALLAGEVEHAAVLVGAADEAIRRLGAPRHPGDVPEHARVLADLRSALGTARLEQRLTTRPRRRRRSSCPRPSAARSRGSARPAGRSPALR